jgi:phage FluMu gp28-like protein
MKLIVDLIKKAKPDARIAALEKIVVLNKADGAWRAALRERGAGVPLRADEAQAEFERNPSDQTAAAYIAAWVNADREGEGWNRLHRVSADAIGERCIARTAPALKAALEHVRRLLETERDAAIERGVKAAAALGVDASEVPNLRRDALEQALLELATYETDYHGWGAAVDFIFAE